MFSYIPNSSNCCNQNRKLYFSYFPFCSIGAIAHSLRKACVLKSENAIAVHYGLNWKIFKMFNIQLITDSNVWLINVSNEKRNRELHYASSETILSYHNKSAIYNSKYKIEIFIKTFCSTITESLKIQNTLIIQNSSLQVIFFLIAIIKGRDVRRLKNVEKTSDIQDGKSGYIVTLERGGFTFANQWFALIIYM